MVRCAKITSLLIFSLFMVIPMPIHADSIGKLTATSELDSGIMFNLVKLPSLAFKAQSGFKIGYKLLIIGENILKDAPGDQPWTAGLLLGADYFSFASSSLLSDGNLYRGFHGYGMGLGAAFLYRPEKMTLFGIPITFLGDWSAHIRITEYAGTSLSGAQLAGVGSIGIRFSDVFTLGKQNFNISIRIPCNYTTMAGASMISTGLSFGIAPGKPALSAGGTQ